MSSNYEALSAVLAEAFEQASHGKGADRHGRGEFFEDQRIMRLGREFGPGFPMGQAAKKLGEAFDMLSRGDTAHARFEILGAIVYAAAAAHLIGEGGVE